MDKKAEALRKYGDAAKAQMMIDVLPQVVAEIAKPLGTIDNVTIIGGGKDSGMGSMADQVPAVLAKTFQSIKATTGVDLAEIMRAETYDAKVNRHYTIDGLKEAVPAVKEALYGDSENPLTEDELHEEPSVPNETPVEQTVVAKDIEEPMLPAKEEHTEAKPKKKRFVKKTGGNSNG